MKLKCETPGPSGSRNNAMSHVGSGVSPIAAVSPTKPLRVTCVNCQEEVTGPYHIKCAVCVDYNFCGLCFRCGAETGSHKPDHAYIIKDHGFYSLFEPDTSGEGGESRTATRSEKTRGRWMMWEDMRLLKAMEQYQYGNWKDVAAVLGTRTPEECEEHYIQCYINGNLGENTWGSVDQPEDPGDDDDEDEDPAEGSDRPGRLKGVVDHTARRREVGQVMDENDTTSLPLANLTPEEALELGFIPKRQDFEFEYDNNAEKLISDLVWDPADELEAKIKLNIVDMYQLKLTERNSRKRAALEHKLGEKFFGRPPPTSSFSTKGIPLSTKWQDREREVEKMFEPLTPYMSFAMKDIIRPMVVQEDFLRSRMLELLEYRAKGYTTLQECFDDAARVGKKSASEPRASRKRKASGEPGPSGFSSKLPRRKILRSDN